ncbi:MAG: Phosphate metabolism transcription protein [Caeruleum heppii]|nr:MAG: Phosphate metabolism transcription protein [Caeruleum heppii]
MSLSTAPPTKASPPAPALEPKTPSKRPDRRSASIPQPTTDAPSGAPRPSVSGETSPKRIRPENPSVKLLPARYDLCHVKDLVVLIADMLNELVRFNDDIPLKDGRLTRFHSRAPPTISIPDYLSRLATHATLSPPILLSMVYYIDRLCSLYPAFIISSLTVHRFLIVAATVASKGLSDSFWTNSTYAKVGGVSLKELALLELEFLEKVGWRIVPRPEVLEDYYRSLVRRSGGFEIEGEGTEGPSTGCGEEVQEQGASVGTSVKSSDESAAASGTMRYGRTLRNAVYPPWKTHYIDYAKLKKLLRETNDGSDKGSPSRPSPTASKDGEDEWTEEDEGAFVDELVNVQLEKVHSFQASTYQQLQERTSNCEDRLDRILRLKKGEAKDDRGDEHEETTGEPSPADRQEILEEVLKELDSITKETNELEKYSRINFTGFLKAAKKHDRKRGTRYRVRPLLQVRLGALPFNSEDYSPLLYRLSAMYSFVRQSLEGQSGERAQSISDQLSGGEKYTSHKFWVHPDNLLEVKTYILRRLPVLVYNPSTSKVAEGLGRDPTITSLYFDNPKFSLYTQKVDKMTDASSLRLRWYGQLSQKPEILFERKIIKEGGQSEEMRFPIKEKYIQPFIQGEYKMEKSVQKLRDKQGGQSAQQSEHLEKSVDDVQHFIKENDLQPVLRANYTRTAFQIPGDGRVRISLDTDLALIREDALDPDRPCRDPTDWHRTDIDGGEMEAPFSGIRKGEICRFPFALLEIKVRDAALKKKTPEWISDLMSSHLVKEAPRFSKFVHGVAQLFEDNVNSFPFWLSELEQDIRKDPGEAFEQEQEKKQKRAEDEVKVGSLMSGTKGLSGFHKAMESPAGKAKLRDLTSPKSSPTRMTPPAAVPEEEAAPSQPNEEDLDPSFQGTTTSAPSSTLPSLFPAFSTSRYSRAHRHGAVNLPPGVRAPGPLIKDSGPVRVEAKVWLANERTFIKWMHVAVLLGSLAIGLYNAASSSAGSHGKDNTLGKVLGVVYIIVAVFAGVWGWAVYLLRTRWIEQRSGRDFDLSVGPVVVCVALLGALIGNLVLKYNELTRENEVNVSRYQGLGGGGVGEYSEPSQRVFSV